MCGWGVGEVRPERRLEDYPSFGSARPSGQFRGAGLLIAASLLVATLGAGASLVLTGGAEAGAQPQPPVTFEAGCDGVWGDEPLDCLLQTV